MSWQYDKFENIKSLPGHQNDSQDDLAAEIEYIKIKGIYRSTRECKKCNRGIANQKQSRCITCATNEYLDDLAQDGGQCKKCPDDTYSPSNSYGLSSCIKRKPCTKDDMIYVYEADGGKECN